MTASSRPVPQPGILDIQAYVPGESSVPGGLKPIKLSSNETPLGASEDENVVITGVSQSLQSMHSGQQSIQLVTLSFTSPAKSFGAASDAAAHCAVFKAEIILEDRQNRFSAAPGDPLERLGRAIGQNYHVLRM